MYLLELRLSEMRNYEQLQYAPERGLNVVTGANAQGKSNLLEAIALLGTGKSFRTSREAEIVREGAALARIAGTARIAAGSIGLACEIARTAPNRARKTYALNGEPVRFAHFLGSVTVVTFVPADLDVVAGAPARRRALLNSAIAQSDPQYYRHLARYRKLLGQKAALLRGPGPLDRGVLEAYDAALSESGAAIVERRAGFIADLGPRAAAAYERWGERGERLEIAYAASIAPGEGVAGFLASIERLRTLEIARRMPLGGPHRDDVEVRLGDRPIAAYGSQGQQRSAVLALKLAEYETLRARTGEAPLFLLDDVLSELDAARARRFLAALEGVEQTFLTATERPAGLGESACWNVVAGTLQAC